MSFGRREPRYATRLPIHYQLFEEADAGLELGPITLARVSDIAEHGVFLSHAALPLHARIHVYFNLPRAAVEAFGSVVHNRPRRTPDGARRAGVGVRFVHVAPRDLAEIERYLRDLKRSHDAAAAAWPLGEPRPAL